MFVQIVPPELLEKEGRLLLRHDHQLGALQVQVPDLPSAEVDWPSQMILLMSQRTCCFLTAVALLSRDTTKLNIV